MELNSVLFRPPVPTYTHTRFGPELIWLPKSPTISIPCLFLPSFTPTHKLFLFFHANAEDLGLIYDFLDILRCVLEVNILAPDYPGYGLYKGKTSCKQILADAEFVHKFALEKFNVQPFELFIIGRSIGSGPATALASKACGGLILLSPYASLRKILKRIVGPFQFLMKDQMKNIDNIKHVTCPTLLIHGKKDSLITYQHSEQLASACRGKVEVFFSETMTHNQFQYYDDVILPIDSFLKKILTRSEHRRRIILSDDLFQPPAYIKKQSEMLAQFI
jgi:abhydrolase domain-containing protein 17